LPLPQIYQYIQDDTNHDKALTNLNKQHTFTQNHQETISVLFLANAIQLLCSFMDVWLFYINGLIVKLLLAEEFPSSGFDSEKLAESPSPSSDSFAERFGKDFLGYPLKC